MIIIYFDFEVAIITPSGVPGIFYEHVLQTSGFVMAVTDSEYAMINGVKVIAVNKYFFFAIFSIDNTAAVWMNVLVVGCNSEG